MKSAAQILREAAEVIEERGKLRDTEGGERSMSRAVAAYNALCGDSMEGELQGWLFMCCLKLARATAGSTHIDDYTDLCGYAALAAECVSKGEADVFAELVRESEELGLYTIVDDPPGRKTVDDLYEKEYGGWIKWEGGDCPVEPNRRVEVLLRNGKASKSQLPAREWEWGFNGGAGDIVAYKVVE